MAVNADAIQAQRIDVIIGAAVLLAVALLLPALQTQAWWLIIPCLICLILRWRMLAVLLLFAAMTYADTWLAGLYFLTLTLLLLMRMSSQPDADPSALVKQAAQQILLALPILVLIAVLIIAAGARWQDRSSPDRASTGVGETMTPGSVSELINNTEIALRVTFDDSTPAPAPGALYWRGIVFEDFDGRSWSRSDRLDFAPILAPDTDGVHYEVAQEPSRQSWLYGLHQAYTSREGTYRDARGILVTAEPVRQRIRYPVVSYKPEPDLNALAPALRQTNLALPGNSNPRTRQWAQDLRQQYPDDQLLTEAVMRHFNDEAFYYTFTPPLMSEQGIDDFLFNRREGFCEHYAGALTFVLRAAGIPSRVVAGYQGGDYNRFSNHWTVYQYNAHAWVEAWHPGQGWVHLDPTTRIAPDRINIGIDAWLAVSQEDLAPAARLRLQLAGIPGFSTAREAFDAGQYYWNFGLFDADGNLRTQDLNQWLENNGLASLPVWLMVGMLLAVVVRVLLTGERKPQKRSPTVKVYLAWDAILRKQGYGRRPAETVTAHLWRVALVVPQQAEACHDLADQLTYDLYHDDPADINRIKARIRDINRAMRKHVPRNH